MKRFFAILLILALGITMVSCGSGRKKDDEQTGGTETEKEIPFELTDLSAAAGYMVTGLGMSDMTELDADSIILRYGIVDKYIEAVAIVSATIASDECVIFKTESETAALEIVELLKTYRDERIELYNGYAPEQTPRLKSAYIDAEGNYVVFAATLDADRAEEIWLGLPEIPEAENGEE